MSDFYAKKVKTYFGHHDANKDGYISLKEFTELADHQSDAAKATPAQREKLKGLFVKVWRCWMTSAKSDDNGLLTPAIMTESLRQQRYDPEFRKAYLEICRSFFNLLDSDGDGFLKEDDYAKGFANIGFEDTSIAHRVFEHLDTKKERKLGLSEFSAAMLEYLTSEDEKTLNGLMWGPLVD